MARSPHDPIYTLGWIGFVATIGLFVLAYQGKPIPDHLKVVITVSVTALTQAAMVYIKRGDRK